MQVAFAGRVVLGTGKRSVYIYINIECYLTFSNYILLYYKQVVHKKCPLFEARTETFAHTSKKYRHFIDNPCTEHRFNHAFMPSTTSVPVSGSPSHIPVLLDAILMAFRDQVHKVHVDGTTGLGGHLLAMLETYPDIERALAIDMDLSHLSLAQERLDATAFGKKVTWLHAPFEDLQSLCDEQKATGQVTSILLDLGLCSAHVDLAERGFSFLREGPLDMRFDTTRQITAATLVNTLPEEQLADIFWRYGEERFSRRIARAIMDQRKKQPLETTTDLADLVASAMPGPKKPGIHPATRVFQALRIAVNDELGQVERVVDAALQVLAPGGRIAVITYHSLEDRIVKHAFREASRSCICPPSEPRCICPGTPRARLINKKPILPEEQERVSNPRSRSAKLRILELLR